MAKFVRSIGFKIFGVSFGLLVCMAVAAWWSASLTNQVHLQLRSISRALLPLTMTLSELHMVAQAQEAHAATGLVTADQATVQACLTTASGQGQTAMGLVARAEAERSLGGRLAVQERGRIAMARLEPMIAELKYQQEALNRLVMAGCAADAGPNVIAKAKEQAQGVERLADAINSEIKAYGVEGAMVVGDNQARAMRANLLMIGLAGLTGLMLTLLIARHLTRPMGRLRAGTQAVSAGRLEEAQLPVASNDEMGDVTEAFNAMVEGLRDKEWVRETFGNFVEPSDVADLLGGGQQASQGEKQAATLFFSGIVGFSSIAERLAPHTLIDLLNAYFSAMAGTIRERSGIINNFISDSMTAFWVQPFAGPHLQARLACGAALEQFARLEAFRAQVPDLVGQRRDIPSIDIRAGLASGEVVVGSVGSDHARSFTVMGEAVNFAALLESANETYGTKLLIDDATHDLAGDSIEAREIDVVMSGRGEAVRIYELAALKGELPAARRQLFDLYAEALAHYYGGEWSAAAAVLQDALDCDPYDGPSLTLCQRIEQMQSDPPAVWNGVWGRSGR